MANINTEKVYTVELSALEQERLNNGRAVEIELPDDVTVKLTAAGGDDVELTGSTHADDVDVGEEPDPDDIEELVQDSEKRAQENRGTDEEPPEDEENGGSGNQRSQGNGIIDIERGG